MIEKYQFTTSLHFWIIVFIALLVLFSVFMPLSFGATNGSHSGYVTAVEYNSNIIWDANLVYFKSSLESTQEDVYCVNDDSVIQQLKDSQKNKERIVIQYQNDFIMWAWQCNGGQSIIYSLETVAP